MKDFWSLQMKGVRTWWDALETGVAIWTTLGARLPMIAAEGMANAEGHRMVAEKIDAATQGALDAGAVAMRLAGTAMLTPQSPQKLAKAGIAIAEAAMRPARRKVKANARRLSKPKRS